MEAKRRPPLKPYWKVTLLYFAFGIIWIVSTDLISWVAAPGNVAHTMIQIGKGSLYVTISAVLIFYLTRSAFLAHARATEEKLKVFQRTVGGAHHILLNYLNQMQLVTLEAEKARDFDKEVLKIAKSISDEAAAELRNLGEIEQISAESIDAMVYRDLEK